jgi:hypothetical protein
MMRPGDLILQDNKDSERATMLIRYVLKAKHENQKVLQGQQSMI